MDPGPNPDLVIDDGRHDHIEATVPRVSSLPRIIVDSHESIRSNLHPVDIELPAFVFQAINLMETVYRLKGLATKSRQDP
jgi:hypothetical protein